VPPPDETGVWSILILTTVAAVATAEAHRYSIENSFDDFNIKLYVGKVEISVPVVFIKYVAGLVVKRAILTNPILVVGVGVNSNEILTSIEFSKVFLNRPVVLLNDKYDDEDERVVSTTNPLVKRAVLRTKGV
jgi:hypothetical protein